MRNFLVFYIAFVFSIISNGQTIIMKKIGRSYQLPCRVNGLDLDFILDTGADDVSISLSEALFMLKNGYLKENELLNSQQYKLANGQLVKGTKIILKSIVIGGLTIRNIEASIVHELDAPLLFGQSALERLGQVSIDYQNNTLTIGSSQVVYSTPIGSSIDYYIKGNDKIYVGDFRGAISDYSKAIELNPNNPAPFYNRGYAKALLNDFHGAISDYSKAIEINPSDAAPFCNRGLAKHELEDFRGAISDFNKTIELDPSNVNAYTNRGNSKISIGDYWGAISDFNKTIELDPNNAEAYNNRGIAKYLLGDKFNACLDLSKAGELGMETAYKLIREYCH